tara:strand:- start:137 stop:256 length:120 start_codon:yes stop_codon:yes gene_type:complete
MILSIGAMVTVVAGLSYLYKKTPKWLSEAGSAAAGAMSS